MAHFYLGDDIDDASIGDEVAITGDESRHAVAVSRIRPGEQLSIGNGAGLVVAGAVLSAAPDRLSLRVETVRAEPIAVPALWLAQALAKGGRDEAAVQAACELGADGVIPWAAERSIVKWEGPKVRRGQERWRAIVREATKQSMRARIPDVGPLTSTNGLIAQTAGARMLVLVPGAELALTDIRPDERDIVLVVGPEGGIAPHEVEGLTTAGASPVRLGSGILRTSTAGPAAIAVLSALLGRW